MHFKHILFLWVVCSQLFMAGCAATPTRESTGEFIDDSVITARIKTAIHKDPVLKSAEINVETFKSVVQLSGFVGSSADKDRAAEVARGIPGVKSVINDIKSK
jgi:osmotically-inducible protein OsmY